MINDYERLFREFKINQIVKVEGCSFNAAKYKFDQWKKNNCGDYDNQLNDFFDQIHPY